MYQLTSVIVHSGISTLSGHYTTFVHSYSDWFRLDDNQVKLQQIKFHCIIIMLMQLDILS